LPTYDDGESFTAGDETAIHFDNDRLIDLFEEVRRSVPDDEGRRRLRLAILRAIFGEAEER
jgi:hypothetical protein